MLVFIGKNEFDPEIVPITLCLNKGEREQIANMGARVCYCQYPHFYEQKEIMDYLEICKEKYMKHKSTKDKKDEVVIEEKQPG